MIQDLSLGHLPRHEMRKTHVWLEQHFLSLRDARLEFGQPIYLLEHTLSPVEIHELTKGVCDALKREPDIGGSWWQERFLPLVIIATEIGYEYRGNGTDYWPLLETALGVAFEYDQRRLLSDYFASCRSTFNCVDRPESDWAKSFCHIAWPIANAVLPLDMRLPFAEAIGLLNRDVRDVSDPELLLLLRQAKVQSWSQRYESWLATGQIAAELTRDFLGLLSDKEYIHDSVRHRIRHDLEKDSAAYKALRNARRRQQIMSQSPSGSEGKLVRTKKRATKQNRVSAKFGRLTLRRVSQTSFELFGEIPSPPKASWNRMERWVRSGRWRPQPWGICNEPCLTPSEVLFSTPFKVPIRALLGDSSEPQFFQDWQGHNPEVEEKEWLESVSFLYKPPLVFIPEDDKIAHQRLQEFVPHGTVPWVLIAGELITDSVPPGVTVLGRIASLQVCQVDTTAPEACRWLGAIGVSVAREVSWSWLASPSFGSNEMPTYAVGDLLAINVQSVAAHGTIQLEILIGEGPPRIFSILEPGLYQLPTDTPGSLHARLLGDGEQLDCWSCHISGDVEIGARPLFKAQLSGVGVTTSALLNDQLTLTLTFDRPVSGFDLEVRTSGGDHPVKLRVNDSPAHFGPAHSLWKKLIGDNTRELIARGGDLTLAVRVCGEEFSWRLENEVSQLHWHFDEDSPPIATTDDARLDVVGWPLNEIFVPHDRVKPVLDAPMLWVAMENGRPRFETGGLVVCPKTSSLSHLPPRPSRLLRQLHGRDGMLGLYPIVEMYLCLCDAKATHIVAAFHCDRIRQLLRSWILEACCGPQWIELSGMQPTTPPLDVLTELALEHSAGFMAALHLEVAPTQALIHAAQMQLALLLPTYWWRLPPMPFGNNDGERYDAAFAAAYKQAADFLPAERVEVASLWANASPFTDVEIWRRVIQITCERLNGGLLADFVLPLAGGDFLLNAAVESASLDELGELFMDWRKQFLSNHRSSEPWTFERARLCLALLLQPQLLRSVAWESSVDALLTDRTSARAIAFIACRVQKLEMLSQCGCDVDQVDAHVFT